MNPTATPEPSSPPLVREPLKGEIYTPEYAATDFRAHPEKYRIGKGEQGVLTVQPYKSEILPHWRFATPEQARASSQKIYQMFLDYKAQGDFAGMDMARKFLQMGWTRSRRYANHKGGKKYDGPVPEVMKGRSGAHGRETLPLSFDPVKAESAAIFYAVYDQARADPDYLRMKAEHLERHEKPQKPGKPASSAKPRRASPGSKRKEAAL